MKRREYKIRKLELTTPEERKEIRKHQLKNNVLFLIGVIAVAIIAGSIGYSIWQSYWNSIPHCIEMYNVLPICK